MTTTPPPLPLSHHSKSTTVAVHQSVSVVVAVEDQ